MTPNLKHLNLQPPIPGYERFIGSYLLCGERNALVDVGPKVATPNLLSALAQLNMKPEEIDYIVLTHIHIDHAGGIGTVIKETSRAEVIAHPRARPHLVDPSRLWEASLKTLGELAVEYQGIDPVPEDRIIDATDQMQLDLGGGLVLETYLTPGHAPHHLSLFDRANGTLIAGEAAGVCVDETLRLATPPPFRLDETLSSIDKLISLEPRTLCYGHFGCYDHALDKLKSIRNKLLEWHEVVTAAAREGKNSEDILKLLREKDKSLDYLNSLSTAEYNRDYILIINSINGLAESARKP